MVLAWLNFACDRDVWAYICLFIYRYSYLLHHDDEELAGHAVARSLQNAHELCAERDQASQPSMAIRRDSDVEGRSNIGEVRGNK